MADLGYGHTAQERSGKRFSICNVTFYRASKLAERWTESRSRALLSEFEVVSGGGGAANGVALTAAAVSGAARVHVANVHLEGHPYKSRERVNQVRNVLSRLQLRLDNIGVDVDDAQLLIAGALVAQCASVLPCRPYVVLCLVRAQISTPAYRAGDFNCTAHEGSYRYLLRGRLEGGYSEACRPYDVVTDETIAQPFLLHDAYASCADFSLPFTYCRPGGGTTIDFIWASDRLCVSGVLRPLGTAAALKVRASGLPNKEWPSDHLPLGVVVDCRAPGGGGGQDTNSVAVGAPSTESPSDVEGSSSANDAAVASSAAGGDDSGATAQASAVEVPPHVESVLASTGS